jgi:hypothetical protein
LAERVLFLWYFFPLGPYYFPPPWGGGGYFPIYRPLKRCKILKSGSW